MGPSAAGLRPSLGPALPRGLPVGLAAGAAAGSLLPAVVVSATGAPQREVPAACPAPPVALPRPSPCKRARRRPRCSAFLSETPTPALGSPGEGRGPGLPCRQLWPVSRHRPLEEGSGLAVGETLRPFVPSKRCGMPVNFKSISQTVEPRKINPTRAK